MTNRPRAASSIRPALLGGAMALCLVAGWGAKADEAASPPPTPYQVAPGDIADAKLAIVDGTPIGANQIAVIDSVVGRNVLSLDPAERRDTVLQMITDSLLLANEARKRGLIEDEATKQRVEFARNQALMDQLLAEVGRQAVTEEAMRRIYETAVLAVPRETEFRLRHLVFMLPAPVPEASPAEQEAAEKSVEAKALTAADRIAKGEDFVALVGELAEDSVTKARGGEVDWSTRGEMGREYAEAVASLKPGDVGKPFKSAVGWHIVRLEESRERKPEDFEQMRDRLAALVASQAQYRLIDDVRAKAKVERVDASAKGETAAR